MLRSHWRTPTLALLLLASHWSDGGIGVAEGAAAASAGAPTASSVVALSQTLTAQAARIKALERQLAKLGSGGKSCASDADDPEPELHAFRVAERQKNAQKKQEELVQLFATHAGEPLSAVAVSSHLLEKSVPRLVVGGGASGALYLYDKNGTLALSLPPDASLPAPSAVSAVVIGPKEDPFVAIGTSGGEVLLYNLTLPRPAIGKRPASGTTSLTLAMRAEAQLDTTGAPTAVLTLDAYMRGRKAMLAVGDASGAVRLLWRNGTQRAAVSAGGAVHAMERGGTNNAFLAVGARDVGVALLDMGKPHSPPMICEGSEPPIPEASEAARTKAKGSSKGTSPASIAAPHVVSVTWDVQLPQLLYAASSDGLITIYNSKTRTKQMVGEFKNESKMVTHCKLVTTITGHDAAPLALTPVKGYLFSASPGLLVSHNVSGARKRRTPLHGRRLRPLLTCALARVIALRPAGLYARARNEPNVILGRALAGGSAVMAGTRAGHVVIGSGPAGELWLLQSKQTFKESKDEPFAGPGGVLGLLGGESKSGGNLGILRNPVVLGVVMMLIFWNANKWWNKDDGPPPGSGGFAGRRALEGRGGLEDFDMDALKAMQRRAGGGKGGAEFEEAFKSTFGRGRNTDFSRDPDVAGSRFEELPPSR